MFKIKGPDGRWYEFWENKDETIICQHRDLSVCDKCSQFDGIVSTHGVHYYIPDPRERAEFIDELCRIRQEHGSVDEG